jgi:Ran GTPase-activating protein (RanGAP) involved in mRNA processing and transport
MGAMTKFDISSNDLCAEGTKLLAAALKGNQNMTELNISSNSMTYGSASGDMSGVIALADVISDMGALSSLSLKSNGLLNKESGEALAGVLKANSVLTELDISSNFDQYNETSQDGAGFAQALAVGLIDNGAILSLNLLQNDIGIDQTKALTSILKEHPTLKSLCGNAGDETELDMSGNEMGKDDAIMLAAEIADNGTLTKLTFGETQVVTMTTEMTEANFSGKLKSYEAQIVAAFLPKCT